MLDLPARSQSGAETSALAEALARHRPRDCAALWPRGDARVWAGGTGSRGDPDLRPDRRWPCSISTRLTRLSRDVAPQQDRLGADRGRGVRRRRPHSPARGFVATDTEQRRPQIGCSRDPGGRRELALPGATPATAEAISADDSSFFEGGWGDVSRTRSPPLGRIVKVGSTAPPDGGGARGDVRRDAFDRCAMARLA